MTQRVAYGLDTSGESVAPRVDGLELSDLEWQVWIRVFVSSDSEENADRCVRAMRAHFAKAKR